MAGYARDLGSAIGYDTKKLADLQTAGMMHDIGKNRLGRTILRKTDPLSREEWDEIQKHPEAGYRILANVDSYDTITMPQPYRTTPIPVGKARRELLQNRGRQFDGTLVDAFVEQVGK